jgi:cytosine/adenosine deaminase-related metal-dependent hydrolase
MQWLNHYTFPAEKCLADERRAAQVRMFEKKKLIFIWGTSLFGQISFLIRIFFGNIFGNKRFEVPFFSFFPPSSFVTRMRRQVYSGVVDRTLRGGTTAALYFATIHLPACKIFADICLQKGQRAFIGKVLLSLLALLVQMYKY